MTEPPTSMAAPEGHTATVAGGNSIRGQVRVAGSKIGAIPIVAATLLVPGTVVLSNVPGLRDIEVLLGLLRGLGVRATHHGREVVASAACLTKPFSLDDGAVTSVHGTLYLLPALLARVGEVHIARTHGGCDIGERPIDHVLDVLRCLGAEVVLRSDRIVARASRLRGAAITVARRGELDKYRSGATKAALLAAATAEGTTTIEGAYTRASITELACCLRSLGARIEGDGTPTITVHGRRLHDGFYRVSGDYLEALTYLALVAGCRGRIEVRGFSPAHCAKELELLHAMGVEVRALEDGVEARCEWPLEARSFSTLEVDTDAQPMLAAALTTARGRATIREIVWERRFGYAEALLQMGASVQVSGQQLEVVGVDRLHGARVAATDLRAASALLIAAAMAEGTSIVDGLGHLPRGYEDLPGAMRELGVRIETTSPIRGTKT